MDWAADRAPAQYSSRSRLAGIAAVVVLHIAIIGALLQTSMRSRAAEVAPMFVKLIPQSTPRVDPPPLPPPAMRTLPRRPLSVPLPDVPVPAPIHVAVAESTPEPAVIAPAVPTKSEPVALAETPAWAPKTISKVEYIRPPQLEYPVLSRRTGEQGRVLLRVLIGREGRAERIEVQVSSGSRLLDEAAVKAAREALYRPYSENGVAIPVWALVPTLFELS